MAAYVKFQKGTEALAEAVNAGTDSWTLILSQLQAELLQQQVEELDVVYLTFMLAAQL